jgi:hypothetical protein
LSFSTAWADEFSGKVVGVTDGDTLTVLRERTPVRGMATIRDKMGHCCIDAARDSVL